MAEKQKKVLNYYFLNKYLHPKTPKGYRENIAALILNKNKGESGKFLMIQEKNEFWTLPKKVAASKNLIDGVVNALILNIGNEMGFRGLTAEEIKPQFTQRAFLFNFAVQKYDKVRSKTEKARKRPSKGKLYHLVIADYRGPNELPIKEQKDKAMVRDFRWVTEKEAVALAKKNLALSEKDPSFSIGSVKFNIQFCNKVIKAFEILKALESTTLDDSQLGLF